ncbi:transposase [Bacillus fengqiuensis]|nr:transposase [Bacillus fengqiuensis]
MNIKNEEKQKAQELLRQGLKPKEVSSLLGVHISTIYSWKKELPPPSKNTIERTIPKNEKNPFSKNEITNESKSEKEYKKDDKIEQENEALKKENQMLKTKIKELEEIITDLVIKLKKTNENWLD